METPNPDPLGDLFKFEFDFPQWWGLALVACIALLGISWYSWRSYDGPTRENTAGMLVGAVGTVVCAVGFYQGFVSALGRAVVGAGFFLVVGFALWAMFSDSNRR